MPAAGEPDIPTQDFSIHDYLPDALDALRRQPRARTLRAVDGAGVFCFALRCCGDCRTHGERSITQRRARGLAAAWLACLTQGYFYPHPGLGVHRTREGCHDGSMKSLTKKSLGKLTAALRERACFTATDAAHRDFLDAASRRVRRASRGPGSRPSPKSRQAGRREIP